jgi:hypothetical protein
MSGTGTGAGAEDPNQPLIVDSTNARGGFAWREWEHFWFQNPDRVCWAAHGAWTGVV